MSVNITVNGNLTKCIKKKPSILDDRELVKKQKEESLRKIRLLQVRDECNNLARKIRGDVNTEKGKQLRNLDDIKAQELESWRNQALVHKHYHYCNAVNQIGAAHLAAKEENESRAAKEQEREAAQKQFKKQLISRVATKKQDNKQDVKKSSKTNEDGKDNAKRTSTQTKTSKSPQKKAKKTQGTPNKNVKKTVKKSNKKEVSDDDYTDDDEEHKRKSNKDTKSKAIKSTNRKKNRNNEDTSDDDEQRQNKVEICSLSSSISSTSDAGSDTDTESDKGRKMRETSKSKQMKKNLKKMEKTPTVVLDVDPVNDGTTEVSMPSEINDKHTETNRKFSCFIGGDEDKNKTNSKRIVIDFHCNSSESMSITVPPPAANKPRKPFFTEISDLIEKYSNTPTDTQPECTQGNTAMTTPATKPISPQKCTHTSTEKSSQKCQTTDTAKTTTTTAISSCSANKNQEVQFYDYNNKYSKNYPQPMSSVRATPRSTDERNAMQEAEIENKLEAERRHDMERKCKLADERGRKALDREQVRRDCQELTELLDKLSNQRRRSLLPTDADLIGSEQYNNMKKRKECKMNAEIEDMLLQPAIITCPEVNTNRYRCREEQYAKRPCLDSNVINLAEKPCDSANDLDSSECSILLDLVNNQSKQIENELKICETFQQPNISKIRKLRYLLQQIEELRCSLIEEINNKTTKMTDTESMVNKKKCSTSRDERQKYSKEEMLQKVYEFIECLKSKETKTDNAKSLNSENKRKSSMTKEEKKSQYKYSNDEVVQKLCEFIECLNSKEVTKNESADIGVRAKDKPLEIIIKMKEDTSKVENNTKSNYAKSPRKLSTIARESKSKATLKKKSDNSNNENYNDSSSTSYQSLPPTFRKCYEEVFEQEKPTNSRSAANKSEPIHPLLAQYIQRLLTMKRDSVMALGVSSSEIQTPNSSVVNTSSNNLSENQCEEQLSRMQKFINDNRSLIKEVEKSLYARKNRTQETINLEIKDSWTNIFNDTQRSDKRKMREDIKAVASKIAKAIEKSYPTDEIEDIQLKFTTERITKAKTISDNKGNEVQTKSKMRESTIPKYKTAATNTENLSAIQPDPNNGDVNVSKYAALTENCTQRIAELTDLINKVRKEKQRLLEHTLSSESLSSAKNASIRTHSSVEETNDEETNDEETQSKTINSTTADAQPTTFQPLEKHKPSSGSHDSGIAMSRPNTSLEIRTDQEPVNQAQSRASKSKTRSTPPPTLTSISPLLADNQIPHELTPILEVDTPLTSRTNITNAGDVIKMDTYPSAKNFPSFDEYAQCVNIDMTLFDESKARQQYNKLIANICEKWKDIGSEFGNIEDFFNYVINKSCEDVEEEEEGEMFDAQFPFDLNCSHLYEIFAKANETLEGAKFQSVTEYMKNLSNANEMLPLDAETLENISEKEIAISKQPKSIATVKTTEEAKNDTDTESLNIEEELKRRKILRRNFTRADIEISSVKTKVETLENSESGIEALSNSEYSGRLEKELLKVGIDWPKSKRKIEKQRASLSSSSPTSMKKVTTVAKKTAMKTVIDSSTLSSIPTNVSSSTEKDHKSQMVKSQMAKSQMAKSQMAKSQMAKSQTPMNLREFLTKELLKHAELSSSSTDDSIKSNFLLSIVGTITPKHRAIMSAQKEVISSTKKWTSTPVNSPTSTNKSSFRRMFSKDTNLSSVVASSSSSSDGNQKNN